MWLFFGFITLASFTIYQYYKRVNDTWGGRKAFTEDVQYEYETSEKKNGMVTKLLVGIDGSADLDFTFKRETLLDRFFKFIGLANEHQVNNREFDDLVYIVSDNQQLHQHISLNPVITKSIIELFATGTTYHCAVKAIRNNSGRLWVKCTPVSGFEKDTVREMASAIADVLKKIADAIERVPRLPGSRWGDPFVIKAAAILAINTGFAINGAIHLFRLVWTDIPFTYDRDALVSDSIFFGAGSVIVLILIALVVLGRSARTHLVLVELVLIGTFGFLSTSFFMLRDINIELDGSAATRYETKAIGKRKTSGKGTSYYLYLDDWNRERKRVKVNISKSFYHSVSRGDDFVVEQRDGYLGYRWVQSVEKKQ